KVSDIVTDTFFYGIANQATESCPSRGLYNRASFLQAVGSYPNFGSTVSTDIMKREIAAFFAHVTYETGYMCSIEEDVYGISANDYCDKSEIQYPCVANKSYHGRGPLNLSWNFNYGEAGKALGFDGLNNPEIVATDAVISFKSALWFWMKNCHDAAITPPQDFGATIRAINGQHECNGADPSAVEARVQYFKDFCNQLGVDPGTNLRC
ncbi:endochitinase EP3-like, partial [Primulina tabacum]|uniref:endochitinase EP3-like n=1 Tax=Primulina tabacum TaxID=48773 RepID=UPI003F59DBD7